MSPRTAYDNVKKCQGCIIINEIKIEHAEETKYLLVIGQSEK
jgi:hypothetical protein